MYVNYNKTTEDIMMLKDKVAIVTGASSGMGNDIAFKYAMEGAKVIAVARRLEKLEHLAEKTKKHGGESSSRGRCLKTKEAENLVIEAIKRFDRLDILVNNAGIMDDFSPVGDVSDEMWTKVMNVNINGPLLLEALLNIS